LRTALIGHKECLEHDTGTGHPESNKRLYAISDRLLAQHLYDFLLEVEAPLVTKEQLLRVHRRGYVDKVLNSVPTKDYAYLDPDTVICPNSITAAKRAAGAVVKAVDMVIQGEAKNAFCAVRPPGHHAESKKAMGFCLFNNIAVGAAHALTVYGLNKVAILDFDVHQGNGTEEIFYNDDRVMFCSTFQHPFYPDTPILNRKHYINVPLAKLATGKEFRQAVIDHWLPALEEFQPEIIFVSAGFDAHRDDDMSGVSLQDSDYLWIAEQIMRVAKKSAQGRIITALEGGYELHSLARSVALYIRVMMNLN
jgi:acetoin utilization deacetylase AcuC-like enzyme